MSVTPGSGADRLLDVAVSLFRRDGFDGVSIDEMVRETGVNRYTLYQRFGDKRGLFLAAIDAYYQERKRETLTLLADPSLEAFEALRRAIFARFCTDDPDNSGCLLINTAVELTGRDREIDARMTGYMREMKGAIEAAISRAKAEGELSPKADPAALADIIFSLFLGAGVKARMGVPKPEIDASLKACFVTLKRS